jgi:hypothetical protein
MTASTSTRPSTVATCWYDYPGDAPDDSHPTQHPSQTRAWVGAWSELTTEQILAHRHLHVRDEEADAAQTVSFFLVKAQGSPYWTSQEVDADVPPVWPGPVLYAPSPHAEYGGAGTATNAMAAATAAAGLSLAGDLGACAVVYPGLSQEQADRLAGAPAPGGALDLATDVAFTRTLGATMDDWWQPMPSRHRRDIRRRWRRGGEAGLLLRSLTGGAVLTGVPSFAPLAAGTALRHGARLYEQEMFERLTAVPDAVLLTAHHEHDLVGGLYGWLHDRCLYLWASGIDYDHLAAPLAYTWLMCESARWAIEQGATRIDAGRANYAAKIRLGHQPQVLRTVIHLTTPQPDTAAALHAFSARLGVQATPHLSHGTRW